uniref:exosome complex component RRP40 isoform X1 n=1 Tax=Myxine glutinosa TaxID=7769 RepID=UPI00358E0AD5
MANVVVLMPGEALQLPNNEALLTPGKELVLGPGLRRDDGGTVVATKAGVLRRREPNVYWIDSHQKRYVPVRGEMVIGIVTAKSIDLFKVDIGCSEHANLSYLAFEGATKRNRPNLQVGDLVFTRLLVANKDMEPEVVCVDSAGRANGLGQLSGDGFLIHTSLEFCRRLLTPGCLLIASLSAVCPCEITVGLNGRVWLRAQALRPAAVAAALLERSNCIETEQMNSQLHNLTDCLANF